MRALTALFILCIPAAVLQGQTPLELSLTSWPDCKIVVTNPTSEDVGVTGLDFQSPGGFLIPATNARPFLFNLQNEPRAVVYAQIPGSVTFRAGESVVLDAGYDSNGAPVDLESAYGRGAAVPRPNALEPISIFVVPSDFVCLPEPSTATTVTVALLCLVGVLRRRRLDS